MNTKPLIGIIGFVLGAGVGFIAAKNKERKKYESKMDAALSDIRSAYANKKKEEASLTEKHSTSTKKEIKNEVKPVENNNVVNTPNVKKAEPYEITYDDLGETGYQIRNLIYYQNGVLTEYVDPDVAGRDEIIINDIDGLVGYKSLESFENIEDDDTIYVRNDSEKSDFEIVISAKDFKQSDD